MNWNFVFLHDTIHEYPPWASLNISPQATATNTRPPIHTDHTPTSPGVLTNTVKPVCNDHLYNKIYYM